MTAGQQYNKHLNYDQGNVKGAALYDANLDEWVMLSAQVVKTEGGVLIYQRGTDDGRAKVDATLTGSSLEEGSQSIPVKNTRFFDYEVMDYTIAGFDGDILYGIDASDQLRKSIDGGAIWGNVLLTLPSSFRVGLYVNSALLLWLDNGDLIRSTDDVVFTTIMSGLKPPLVPGVAYHINEPSKIMFAEYTNVTDGNLNVYYSGDTGATWTPALTQNRPTDIEHFHTVDFLISTSAQNEWVVTSGDGYNTVKWWRSVNNGTTWEQVVNGVAIADGDAQVFRTLGVRRISPRTYIWAGDSFNQNYIFACDRDNITTDNKGAVTEVRRVYPLGAQAWALAGGKHWLVVADKVESSSNQGAFLNRISVSGDSGGSWFHEYELFGKTLMQGVLGIQGPDALGRFYVRVSNAENLDNKTIRMAPISGMSYPAKPIDQNLQLREYKKVVLKNVSVVHTGSTWSEPLSKTIYDPVLVVTNTTDKSVVVGISTGSGSVTDLETGQLISKDILTGRTAIIGAGDQLLKSMIPKGYLIGCRSVAETPTTGNVTVTLYGKSYECTDHRAM